MEEGKKKRPKRYNTEYPVVSKVSDIDMSRTYSYAHYLRWEFEDRLELIRGKIFKMAAPAPFHQVVSWRITGELYNYLKGKSCSGYAAPFDVRLPGKSLKDEDIYTVVQPDITILCDQRKIDNRGCIGAPDIAVEILSPGNSKKELKIKFDLYQEYGVPEYWIVDPVQHHFMKYVLNAQGFYDEGHLYKEETDFVSDILPGLKLNVREVFEDQPGGLSH